MRDSAPLLTPTVAALDDSQQFTGVQTASHPPSPSEEKLFSLHFISAVVVGDQYVGFLSAVRLSVRLPDAPVGTQVVFN